MRSRLLALFAALLLVGSLAACGSDSDDDADATTTTAAQSTTAAGGDDTTTTAGGDGTTTTAGGDDTSTTVSIPSEEPSEAFCEGWRTVDETENPEGLDAIKSAYADLVGAAEQMRDNAPADLEDTLTDATQTISDANEIIQDASSEQELEDNEELNSLLSGDLDLTTVEAYGEKYC